MTRSHMTRLKPIKIHYRNYKFCSDECFQRDLSKLNLVMNENDPDNMYSELVQNFCGLLNKHAPLKANTSEVTMLHL